MTFSPGLVAHLSSRLRIPDELIAAQSLEFLLVSSSVVRDGLRSYIRAAGVDLPELSFAGQFVDPDVGRPDLIGAIDEEFRDVRLIMEVKFWAPLTDRQPCSYLKRLTAGEPGLLLFVAPQERLAVLWSELLGRVTAAGLVSSAVMPDEVYRSAGSASTYSVDLLSGHVLALRSWDEMLEKFDGGLRDAGEDGWAADLAQLERLVRAHELASLDSREKNIAKRSQAGISRSPLLNVWLGEKIVADLVMTRRSVPQLRYRAEMAAERGIGALGLTCQLSIDIKPYRGELVERWVESLLPEGEARTILEGFFRLRRGDSFGLLAELGRECAGAVAVFPEGRMRDEITGPPDLMSSAELDQAITAVRSHPLGIDGDVRLSLGGMQPKLPLVQIADGWAHPAPGFPSTHILKPDSSVFPGLVPAEAFAQKAAELAGLDVAESSLESFGGRMVLVIKRFDRPTNAGGPAVSHQEDGCQALGIDPCGSGRYQSSARAASYRRLAAVIEAYACDKGVQLRKLGAMLTFTIAIGNADAHLRNHAFLRKRNSVTLAPIYDAAPTAEIAGTRQLALWVDGQSLLTVVRRDHIVRELVSWGIDPHEAVQTVESTLSKLSDVYDEAARLTPEVAPSIVQACQRRTETLLR